MFNLILKMMATTTKLENKLQAIYNEGGYDIYCDNRSYYTKSINKALQNSSVDFMLIKKGYVATQGNGFKWNLRIRIEGKGKVFNLKSFSPETIAECFASVSRMEHVKESIHIHEDAYPCTKCGGEGIIPAFMHVCEGVCFDCLGIGYKFHSGKW